MGTPRHGLRLNVRNYSRNARGHRDKGGSKILRELKMEEKPRFQIVTRRKKQARLIKDTRRGGQARKVKALAREEGNWGLADS